MSKNLGGRPTKMTDEVVRKLEEGFVMGLNDAEASLYAGICKQTLYDYCKLHPEFTDRKELLKEQPKIRAKKNITEAIDKGNITVSQWYMERRSREEFSLKQEVDLGNKDDKPFEINVTMVK